jgi:ribose transport system ATP-binding protein
MTPLLEMRSVHKSFYGVKVLQDVPLTLYPGEVLALLGENGAGKSTLIKILNGDYTMDAGEIYLEGQQVHFKEPRDAEKNGIVMIYQELHYAPDLSVAENLFIGKLPRGQGPLRSFVDWQSVKQQAKKALALLNVEIDPDTLMRDLTVVERQIVEIVKAVYADAKLLVMDEPTAALTPPEVEMLFGIVRRLREKGVGIIYISHRLDEIFQIAQRVTVLRDGKHVATKSMSEVTPGSLVEMMVGREIETRNVQLASVPKARKVALEVSHLSKAGAFEDISFKVHEGEVVSIFGLLGSGQTNLTRCIFGAERFDSGGIKVNGEAKNIRRPQDGKNAGIGFVPIDRKVRGLVLGMSVRKNLTLSNWAKLSTLSFFQPFKERQHTRIWIDALGIRMAGGMDVPVRFLSGGNQQKVVLARWLEANVKILILNEPTWGVDVGARSDIYDQLESLAKQGLAILVVSSDIQEVLSISQRILTIYKGRLTAEFNHQTATQEHLLVAAAGGKA